MKMPGLAFSMASTLGVALALGASATSQQARPSTLSAAKGEPSASVHYQEDAKDSATGVVFREAEDALREGKYQRAETGFRKVLESQPKLVPALCDLGVVCLRTHRAGEAIRYFDSAHELAPRLTGVNLDLGLAYYQENNFQKAIPEFETVLRATPNNLQAAY